MVRTAKPQSQTLFAELEQVLSIWSKLSAQNKDSFKIVITQKIEALSKCREDPKAPYDLLEGLVSVKDQLATMGFDVATLEAAISTQVEKLRVRAESRDTIDLTVSSFFHTQFTFSIQITNTRIGGHPAC